MRRGRPPKLYANLAQDFTSDPRQVQLSHAAFRLFIIGRLHASGELTDGVIAASALPGLLTLTRTSRREVEQLLASGLWRKGKTGTMVDVTFLDTNQSRVQRTRGWQENRDATVAAKEIRPQRRRQEEVRF